MLPCDKPGSSFCCANRYLISTSAAKPGKKISCNLSRNVPEKPLHVILSHKYISSDTENTFSLVEFFSLHQPVIEALPERCFDASSWENGTNVWQFWKWVPKTEDRNIYKRTRAPRVFCMEEVLHQQTKRKELMSSIKKLNSSIHQLDHWANKWVSAKTNVITANMHQTGEMTQNLFTSTSVISNESRERLMFTDRLKMLLLERPSSPTSAPPTENIHLQPFMKCCQIDWGWNLHHDTLSQTQTSLREG